MATRKRGRPRKIGPRPEVAAALELPPVTLLAETPGSSEDALAALDAATRSDAPASPPNAGDVAGGASSPAPSAPTGAPTPSSPAPPPRASSTNGNGVHHAPPAPPATSSTPPRPRPERSITGKQYSGLLNSQLRTALAIAENKNAELEAQLRAAVPVATAAKVVALERMTAVVVSALFDLAALATSIDEVRLDRQEETELGELGAPAIAPYLGQYAQHAPLIAFGAKLATVITTKVLVAKAVNDAKRRGASNGT